VPLLDRAYQALVEQLQREQARGFGAEGDYVFTSVTGRPLGAHRISKRGVTRSAKKAGLAHVTPQALRRSVATATAPCEVAGRGRRGHDRAFTQVYDAHYAKPFRDEEERAKVRESLTSIGFGVGSVDQPLTSDPPD
jgi:integrase